MQTHTHLFLRTNVAVRKKNALFSPPLNNVFSFEIKINIIIIMVLKWVWATIWDAEKGNRAPSSYTVYSEHASRFVQMMKTSPSKQEVRSRKTRDYTSFGTDT